MPADSCSDISRTPSSQPAFSNSSVTVGWIEPKLVWLPMSCLAMAAMTSPRPRFSSERAFSPMHEEGPGDAFLGHRFGQPLGDIVDVLGLGADIVLGVERDDKERLRPAAGVDRAGEAR